MNRLPEHVLAFAGQKADVYEGMRDYFFHYMSETQKINIATFDSSVSLKEKEEKMHKAYFEEVKRLSAQPIDDNKIDFKSWCQNPMVKWAANTSMKMMIEAILPDTIINSIGLYTEMRNGAWGETAEFEIAPNTLFTVSDGTYGARQTFRQKDFKRSITLIPTPHELTVYASLYRVLCEQETLAEFVRKAVVSIQTKMTRDAYDALEALVNGATFPSALKVTGFTMEDMVHLAEVVTSYNGGAKAMLVGTTSALMHVLPDSTDGYRLQTPANAIDIQLIKNVYGYDILVLPQVATGSNYGLALRDDRIYVMSPSADKLIKGFMEGAELSNSNDYFDTADLTSNYTLRKNWVFEAATNAIMGVIDL